MGTSHTPYFNYLAERLGTGCSTTYGHQSAGGHDRVFPVRELSGKLGVRTPQADSNPGLSVPLPVLGEYTGGHRFDTQAIELNECVRSSPACSSTDVY